MVVEWYRQAGRRVVWPAADAESNGALSAPRQRQQQQSSSSIYQKQRRQQREILWPSFSLSLSLSFYHSLASKLCSDAFCRRQQRRLCSHVEEEPEVHLPLHTVLPTQLPSPLPPLRLRHKPRLILTQSRHRSSCRVAVEVGDGSQLRLLESPSGNAPCLKFATCHNNNNSNNKRRAAAAIRAGNRPWKSSLELRYAPQDATAARIARQGEMPRSPPHSLLLYLYPSVSTPCPTPPSALPHCGRSSN